MKEILQRINLYLLFFVLLVVVLYFGRVILIPVFFAALLAMLMAPVCRKLDKKGFNRALSAFSGVFILIVFILAMLGVLGAQVASFSKDAPQIEEKAKKFVSTVQDFVQNKFGISKERQTSMAKEQTEKVQQSAVQGVLGKIAGSITTTLGGLVLTLVFTFLFLYNKEKYEIFFVKLYKEKDPAEVKEVVNKISGVAQQYLAGRVMSILIIAALYTVGLLAVGIKNAVLLAGVAALFTLIPYLGTVLGGLFPVLMALVTEDSFEPALWAALVLFVIQTLDNYFIEPNVVGGEVNLGALPTILGIICGGLIWGPAGMILFIPMLGIAKIIFDHVEGLKPYGYLIGEPNGGKPSKIKQWIKEKMSKRKN